MLFKNEICAENAKTSNSRMIHRQNNDLIILPKNYSPCLVAAHSRYARMRAFAFLKLAKRFKSPRRPSPLGKQTETTRNNEQRHSKKKTRRGLAP